MPNRFDSRLSQIAQVPVFGWRDADAWGQYLTRYGLKPGGLALYEPRKQGTRIHMGPTIYPVYGLIGRGFYRTATEQQRAAAAAAIYVLAREIGHTKIRDAIHGQPGHDDPGANAYAWKNYKRIAAALGISSPRNRTLLQKQAREVLKDFLATQGLA